MGEGLAATLVELPERAPLSYCLNDGVEDVERDGWMWDVVGSFLDDCFPSPSPFEAAAA